jgi:hypothetical protein
MPPGPRAGFTFAVHKKQAVMFGGVVDHEKDRGEIIVSEFYNETYTFQVWIGASPFELLEGDNFRK